MPDVAAALHAGYRPCKVCRPLEPATGQPEWAADLVAAIERDPARPRSARSDSRFGRLIDDELETILLKALEKAPERRYQTAGDLARDLRHYLNNEPIEAKRASGLYLLRKLLRRYRLQATAAALVLSMLVVCLIVVAYLYRQEHQLRREFEILERQAQIDAEHQEEVSGIATFLRDDELRVRLRSAGSSSELYDELCG